MSNAYHVCFVCRGNICRSPMAEWVLRKRVDETGLGGEVEVTSSGLDGRHVGEHADHRTVYALRTNGYECEHVASQFEAQGFEQADLVVALDEESRQILTGLARSPEDRGKIRLLREFDPEADGELDVPDPYQGTSANFTAALRLIETSIPGLLDEIRVYLGVGPEMAQGTVRS